MISLLDPPTVGNVLSYLDAHHLAQAELLCKKFKYAIHLCQLWHRMYSQRYDATMLPKIVLLFDFSS